MSVPENKGMSCTPKRARVHVPTTEIIQDPETGRWFERTTCINCGRWLHDRPLSEPEQ